MVRGWGGWGGGGGVGWWWCGVITHFNNPQSQGEGNTHARALGQGPSTAEKRNADGATSLCCSPTYRLRGINTHPRRQRVRVSFVLVFVAAGVL